MAMIPETRRNGNEPEDVAKQLNSLLRGEISAVETYRMAIDKVKDNPDNMAGLDLLRGMHREHGRAAQEIRGRIRDLDCEATDSSGAWGAWAQTVQGTMNLFGDTSALKALKEGEEHGLKDYQRSVDEVDPATRQLIESQLIPAQERHVSLIDQLMRSAGNA